MVTAPILPTNILGNFSPYRTATSGSGRTSMKTPFDRMMVTGKAGQVIKICTSDLYPSPGAAGLVYYAQAIGGAVTIAQTLAPPDLAMDPLQDDSLWDTAVSFSPKAIKAFSINCATVLKITFTADAIVYLASS